MYDYKPGDAVIVRSKGTGAEVVKTGLPNGQVKVKIAHIHFTGTGVRTYSRKSLLTHPTSFQLIRNAA